MFTEYILNLIQKAERGEPVEMPPGDWGILINESFSHYLAKDGAGEVKRFEKDKVRAVLVSGGIDSTVAYYIAKEKEKIDGIQTRAFYMNFDTGYQDYELEALKIVGIEPEVVELPIKHDADRWGFIVPGRNLVFIVAVAELLNKEGRWGEVWLSPFSGESKPCGSDKSDVFFSSLNRILAALPYPFTLKTPLIHMTKTGVVEWWIRHGLPIDKLLKTRTCHSHRPVHCGRCQACFNRWVALQNNGIAHLQEWENPKVGETVFVDKIVRDRVREAITIHNRGFATTNEALTYKAAKAIIDALTSDGIELDKV